jgi:hypothetical protein
MKTGDGPGPLDVLVVVLSPLIVAGLTVIFLLGWWVQAAWRWVGGRK